MDQYTLFMIQLQVVQKKEVSLFIFVIIICELLLLFHRREGRVSRAH